MTDLDGIYRQYAQTVYRFLLAKTGSPELAEELTQETFYQAVQSIGRYDGSCQISTWLCGIARNVLLNHNRKQKHASVSLEEVPEPAGGSAEDTVLGNMGRELLLTAIHKQPEPGREVLYLKRVSMGPLSLDGSLEIGAYRRLTEEEESAIMSV